VSNLTFPLLLSTSTPTVLPISGGLKSCTAGGVGTLARRLSPEASLASTVKSHTVSVQDVACRWSAAAIRATIVPSAFSQ
jgi:hypothetical protein